MQELREGFIRFDHHLQVGVLVQRVWTNGVQERRGEGGNPAAKGSGAGEPRVEGRERLPRDGGVERAQPQEHATRAGPRHGELPCGEGEGRFDGLIVRRLDASGLGGNP